MIILYITLWLLSGFLAAWVFHRFIEYKDVDYGLVPVVVFTVLGLFAVLVVIVAAVCETAPGATKRLSSIVVFKAKEPK